jgi:hypothetical protein
MEWKSVRVPREALDKLAKLRESLARDLCDTPECRQYLMDTLTPGRFFSAAIDVVSQDNSLALRLVLRLYEKSGITAYVKAKEMLDKRVRGGL